MITVLQRRGTEELNVLSNNHFSFDPALEDELMAVAQAAADEMKAIVGIQSAVIVRVAEGKTVTIAAYDTEASAIAAQPKVQAVLGQIVGMLSGPPEIHSGPVLLDHCNDLCFGASSINA